MDAYTNFAVVYDTFMDDTPYEEWSTYMLSLLEKEKITGGILLDLGCGTGTITELLAKSGYDVIGIDNSADMLNIAIEKKAASGHDILYLMQDMRAFELYGTVKAVVSVCDCLNYIINEEELLSVFRLVNNYLDPGGVFIFDFNSVHKYRDVIGDTVIAENRENCSFIWENYYDTEDEINEYDLTLFVKVMEEEKEEIYKKFTETHVQRGYELETIKDLLEKAGLQFVNAYDGFCKKQADADSERICVVARECKK